MGLELWLSNTLEKLAWNVTDEGTFWIQVALRGGQFEMLIIRFTGLLFDLNALTLSRGLPIILIDAETFKC